MQSRRSFATVPSRSSLFVAIALLVLALTLLVLLVKPALTQQTTDVQVWVNTNSGVYHCPGTRWYGNTKHGKYMGECAAIKDGNRPAYGKACGSDCQSASTMAPSPAPSAKTEHAGNPDTKVWVNTSSGVYHCPGTRWYGTTKHGEFMTQKKAQDGGYRPAYGKFCQ